MSHAAPVIDVGGGTSTLVDLLLDADYRDITVLDISGSALEANRTRLGDRASNVVWIETDILKFEPSRRYHIWHDRAAFHFLVDPGDVETYLDIMHSALAPEGYLILSTFGPEGPERCSNLVTRRYSIDGLARLLGSRFDLVAQELDNHQTPGGMQQQFLYSLWRARKQ